MERAINWLSLFLIAALASAFMFYQLRVDSFGVLFNDRPSVPVLVLSFAPFIQIGVLAFALVFMSDTSPAVQLFPRLFGYDMGTSRTNLLWERLTALVVLGLPVLALSFFWARFFSPRHRVWHTDTGIEIGRFDYVSPMLFFGNWNRHRFGGAIGEGGASFVPFWQPVLIMGMGSLVVVAMTALVAVRLLRRDVIRRRVVQREH